MTTVVRTIGPLFDGRLFRNIVTEELKAVQEAGSLVVTNAKRLAPVSGQLKRPGVKNLKQSITFFSGIRQAGPTKTQASFFPKKDERSGNTIFAQFYSVWYTHFPERGTRYQRAQFFLRRAMQTSKPIVLKLMTRGVNDAVRKSIAREISV